MNLNHLEYFLVLAQTQHYTKAADILHITQPTLSHAISNLEEELNVPLFQKKGRNSVLTEYGLEFVGYVERSMSLIKEGVNRLEYLKEKKTEVIHIAFLYTLSSDFIPQLIQAFKRVHDSIQIEFSLFESDTTTGESTQELTSGLQTGRFDVIFINRVDSFNKSFEFKPLFKQDYRVICSLDSPLAQLQHVDLGDLQDLPMIQYANRYGTRNEIKDLFSSVGVKPNIIAEIDDEMSISSMVASGLGYSITPMKKIYETLDLKCLPLENPVHERMIYMGYEKNSEKVESVKQFIEFVSNEFKFDYGM